MYALAKDLLTQCKQSALLQDLDEAISLFREALLQRPDPRIMRMYALNNLAMGLVTRFDYVGRPEDLDEAITLARESGAVRSNVLGNDSDSTQAKVSMCVTFGWRGMLIGGSQLDYISQPTDGVLIADDEPSDPTGRARDALAKFIRSTTLPSLETSIALHRDVLHQFPALHSECSLSLAEALVLRSRHATQPHDLDEAISLLISLDSRIGVEPRPHVVLARTSATFLTKFIVSGSELDREKALTWHDQLQVCAAESWVSQCFWAD